MPVSPIDAVPEPADHGVWATLIGAAAGNAATVLPEWPRVAAALQRLRPQAAGSVVFLQDQPHPHVYAVRQGLVKLSYLAEHGSEWIKSFADEGRFFASLSALEGEASGRTSFMASVLEPGTLLERLDYRLLQALAARHLGWSEVLRRLTMVFAARKELRERELLTLRPEARYRAFVAAHPALAGRVPQKELARHLGLTAVGLNRIVQRVRAGERTSP